MLELFLGQIPEAIYFALFIIFTKKLKEKRLLFIVLMILEYLLLKSFLHYNIWFQVSYTFLTFVILKMLYKEKAQITDIFTFMIASLILMIISIVVYFPIYWLKPNFMLSVIISRVSLFTVLFVFSKKLYNIQKLYKKLWNRNDKIKKKIKTTTFRCISLTIFNLMFFILNFYMVYTLVLGRSV